jgi:dCMP deaminase
MITNDFSGYVPPSWDEYFMRMVYLVATKSKDPRTKIGAVLTKNKKVVATGYNGICMYVDDTIPERSERPEKYKWYEHGERNCIYAAAAIGISTVKSTMYTNGTPCADCTRAIIQSGVAKVIVHKTFEDAFYATIVAKNPNSQWVGHDDASHQMLQEAGVELIVWDGYLGVEAFMDGKKFVV